MCDFPYQVAHYHVLVSNWGHHVLPGTWPVQGDEIYVEFYIKGLKENMLPSQITQIKHPTRCNNQS